MKKVFSLIVALMCFSALTFAQKKDDKAKAVPAKKETTKPAPPTAKPAATATPAKSAATAKPEEKHLKKDGTPDMRYKENKEAKPEAKHLKKDGTPDMRYKENKEAAKKKG
jgi:hypothetical protein